jgi:hypothetical protein
MLRYGRYSVYNAFVTLHLLYFFGGSYGKLYQTFAFYNSF